jgi:hypothetical protein
MTAIEAKLIERLKKLSPSRLAEVANFVDFLAASEERAAAAHGFTEGLVKPDALKLPPVCEDEDEVEATVRPARWVRAGAS